MAHGETKIDGRDLHDPVRFIARRRGHLGEFRPQIFNSFAGNIGQQRFAARVMAVRRRMRYAGPAGDGTQRQGIEALFFQNRPRAFPQCGTKLAVVIGPLNMLIH